MTRVLTTCVPCSYYFSFVFSKTTNNSGCYWFGFFTKNCDGKKKVSGGEREDLIYTVCLSHLSTRKNLILVSRRKVLVEEVVEDVDGDGGLDDDHRARLTPPGRVAS